LFSTWQALYAKDPDLANREDERGISIVENDLEGGQILIQLDKTMKWIGGIGLFYVHPI